MAGRAWTKAEDRAIRAAALNTREGGMTMLAEAPDGEWRIVYASRLRRIAERYGRTYAAVRKRASRIGAVSYAKRR